jgi:hypothetical protein
MNLINFTEIASGEQWEDFARDFLEELGFRIESPPTRGPDLGKDLLISEQLSGKLGNYSFRWLVSCKHFAESGRSVGTEDEPNIRDRLEHFKADGFLGFYSTLPSSALNMRLEEVDRSKQVDIFSGPRIESILINKGLAILMSRYFPESHILLRPLHPLFGKYMPLPCCICAKDLLLESGVNPYNGNIVFAEMFNSEHPDTCTDVYTVCKVDCDRLLQKRLFKAGMAMPWKDIGDLLVPREFIDWTLMVLTEIRDAKLLLTDKALEDLRRLIKALSQKVLREMTETDIKRYKSIASSEI